MHLNSEVEDVGTQADEDKNLAAFVKYKDKMVKKASGKASMSW